MDGLKVDAYSSGNYPDIDQVEVPESAQLYILVNGNVEEVAQLDLFHYLVGTVVRLLLCEDDDE